jgi:hypothetical protein
VAVNDIAKLEERTANRWSGFPGGKR